MTKYITLDTLKHWERDALLPTYSKLPVEVLAYERDNAHQQPVAPADVGAHGLVWVRAQWMGRLGHEGGTYRTLTPDGSLSNGEGYMQWPNIRVLVDDSGAVVSA